jgi:hypothetical protein
VQWAGAAPEPGVAAQPGRSPGRRRLAASADHSPCSPAGWCGWHGQQALQAYASEDAEDVLGALTSINDELPKLRDRHARAVAVFAQAGIDTFDTPEDIEACVDLLADEALRARFSVVLKAFLSTLDTVMPRPYTKGRISPGRGVGAQIWLGARTTVGTARRGSPPGKGITRDRPRA